MKNFLQKEQLSSAKYDQIYTETMKFLRRVYREKIDHMEEETIAYNISDNIGGLVVAPYTEETFLCPDDILRILKNSKSVTDLSEYKEIIEMILVDHGEYQLLDKDRNYYVKNFDTLLKTSSLIMQNNNANHETLINLSQKIYDRDKTALIQSIGQNNSENCQNAEKYLELYEQF
jgi:hypothetical protein